MTLLFIGSTELLLIGGLALLMFGGKKLPEMMRGLGQGVKEFKKGMQGSENDKTTDSNDMEKSDSESKEESSKVNDVENASKDK